MSICLSFWCILKRSHFRLSFQDKLWTGSNEVLGYLDEEFNLKLAKNVLGCLNQFKLYFLSIYMNRFFPAIKIILCIFLTIYKSIYLSTLLTWELSADILKCCSKTLPRLAPRSKLASRPSPTLYAFHGFIFILNIINSWKLNRDNGYRIRGYIDKEKFVVNLGCLYGTHLLVSSFIQ